MFSRIKKNPTEHRQENAIESIIAPLIGDGIIEHAALHENAARAVVRIPMKRKAEAEGLIASLKAALLAHPSIHTADVLMTAESAPQEATDKNGTKKPAPLKPAQWNLTPLPHVKRIIAVASGKGGVGKSTLTKALAETLQSKGVRAGILDADIHGPSQPRMMGLMGAGKPDMIEGILQPLPSASGVLCMSVGFLMNDQAAIMRGPMVSKALHQMLRFTAWGTEQAPLDVLFIDMPPGTGDIALTLAQACPLSGAMIVTTPQDIAIADADKAAQMFAKLDIPILGVIENMAYFEEASGTRHAVFGQGGGEALAKRTNSKLLAQLPLDARMGEACDTGAPLGDAIYQKLLDII